MESVNIIGEPEPPRGWSVLIWVGDPGTLTCPECKGNTHTLLRRTDDLADGRGRCRACIPPTLRAV